jgi:uncharacterized membrane protein
MTGQPRLIARIALFSALVYVLSWVMAPLPNIGLMFFVVFTAGYVWGATAGALVGLVGEGLFSTFNPYGPVAFPIAVAQVFGAMLCGLIGASANRLPLNQAGRIRVVTILALLGIICSVAFYGPVSITDAWLWKPFWPRLIAGLPWIAWSLAANAIIFPLLFPVTLRLYRREGSIRR